MPARVVFLCKGSRGDTQPLLSIAICYKQRHAQDEVVFACSPSSLLGMETAVAAHSLIVNPLPDFTPPLRSLDAAQVHELVSDGHRLTTLEAEAVACIQAAKGASLIVFNLFTLEGYFIAHHLQVPCLAVSPHIITRTPPSGFEEKLAKAHPQLYQRLKSPSPGEVSYSEVDHWMWRLFIDDLGHVCETLGLPQVPISSEAIPLSLPPPTTLLYGVSSTVLPRQQYWPASVVLCGYWMPSTALQVSPDPSLAALIEGISPPLLYVGFGSMESYMLDVKWDSFLKVLQSALESTSMEAIFQCSQGGPIAEAHSHITHPLSCVHLWPEPLPHPWLFNRCSAILHHGGSGTAATALIAQRPQIICPIMFDQQFWAEHLSWEGVAHQCPHVSQLNKHDLVHALTVVTGGAMKRRVAEMGELLSREDGIGRALMEIEKLVQTHERVTNAMT